SGCGTLPLLVATLDERGITSVIPPKANRKEPRKTDFALYRERNLVERFFNKLKQYRGIATRFDKLATTFLAGVLLVCVVIWLNARHALARFQCLPQAARPLAPSLHGRARQGRQPPTPMCWRTGPKLTSTPARS